MEGKTLTSPSATKVPLWTKSYTFTILATLCMFIPWALFMPVLPVYILDKLHGSPAAAGAANAAFLIAMVLFRAQTDRLESRYGIRPVLFAGGLLFTCSNFLFLAAGSTTTILILRFLSGVVFAIVNTSLSSLGSLLAPFERKGEGLAYVATAVTAATAIGPYVGLSLARTHGFMGVFCFCGLITLAGSFISLGIVIPGNSADGPVPPRRLRLGGLYEARAVPASSIIMLMMIAISAVLTFASVYASSLHLDGVATYFFVVMALCAIGARLLTGRGYDRFGANCMIYPAILFLAFGLLILGRTGTTFGMFSAAALIGFSYGIAVPSLQALAYHQSPAQRLGVVTATYFTMFDLGMGAGSYLVGVFIPLLGYANLYLLLSPFVLAVALLYHSICGKNRPFCGVGA
jgi:MFS family permease